VNALHDLYILSAVFNCGIGVFLFTFVMSQGVRLRANRYFAYFCFSVAVWSLLTVVSAAQVSAVDADLYLRLSMSGLIVMPAVYFHFLMRFLDQADHRRAIQLNYILAGIFAGSLSTSLYAGSRAWTPALHYRLDPGPFFHLSVVHGALVFGYSLYHLVADLRGARGIKKVQICYVLAGTVMGVAGVAAYYLTAYGIDVPSIFRLGVAAYLIVQAYAMLKYRLMDIRIALSSAGIFLSVYSLALGIPCCLYWKGHHLAALASAILLATPAPVIYGRLKKQAAETILHGERACQQILLNASKGLSRHKAVDTISAFLVSLFHDVLRVNRLALYLNDGHSLVLQGASVNGGDFSREIKLESPLAVVLKQGSRPLMMEEFIEMRSSSSGDAQVDVLNNVPAEIFLPLVRNDVLLGVVCLGERDACAVYSARDMEVLGVIADQAALAIENSVYLERSRKDFMQEMHDRRLKDIGLLGSTVSHQMSNRLQRVLLGAGLFRMNFSDDALAGDTREQLVEKLMETHEDMRVMENNAASIVEISDALKTFSKPGVGASSVSLRRLIKIAKDLADAKHQAFSYGFVQGFHQEADVWVNIPSIQDVFFNAFDNSIDSMSLKMRDSSGRFSDYVPRVSVRAWVDGINAVVEIEDNGLGVRPEDEGKLFIPFFTTKGSDRGTGLGLHAMRELARRNGGDIAIESRYLHGVVVTVTLPLAVPGQGAAAVNLEEVKGEA
jgi:signal transduction histidine kinase